MAVVPALLGAKVGEVVDPYCGDNCVGAALAAGAEAGGGYDGAIAADGG